MDKIGLNMVGLAVNSMPRSLRIYNHGGGFVGAQGVMNLGAEDSLYALVTALRDYRFTVDGDLVMTAEPGENGVTPFDFNWSAEAKARGEGRATITIVNPDVPEKPSRIRVEMSSVTLAAVEFQSDTGNNVCLYIDDDSDVSIIDPAVKRALAIDADPYRVGLAIFEAAAMAGVTGNFMGIPLRAA
ncbi:MAG: hypothetical protein AB7W16_12170 [Candidatus Obscuribacterales bacterium]